MLKCNDHPRYSGKSQPKSPCIGCWAVYLGSRLDGPKLESTRFISELKKYRKKNKLTIRKMALKARMSEGSLSKLLRSKYTTIKRPTAEHYADLLGLYGDERLLFIYSATAEHRRFRNNIAFDITGDVGQAVVREVLQNFRHTCLMDTGESDGEDEAD